MEWQPIETAPKDGTQILAVFSDCPFVVMAVWCGASSAWCAAVPQVDIFLGEINDWYFENEYYHADSLKTWSRVIKQGETE